MSSTNVRYWLKGNALFEAVNDQNDDQTSCHNSPFGVKEDEKLNQKHQSAKRSDATSENDSLIFPSFSISPHTSPSIINSSSSTPHSQLSSQSSGIRRLSHSFKSFTWKNPRSTKVEDSIRTISRL